MKIDCSSYAKCTAPLCPLDKSLPCAVWFPDEALCVKHGLPADIRKVIRVQRRIARRTINRELSYDVSALTTIKLVRSGIKGHNSDRPKRKLQKASTAQGITI